MIKRISKILLPAILIPGALAGCAAAAGTGTASAATVADVTGATHIAVWSVNSDGLTISLDEDYIKGPTCSEETAFQSQLIMITGTGSARA